MISENYVSVETASLLKKKGFDCEDVSCVNFYKGHIYVLVEKESIIAVEDLRIPTLQMALKWLREVHNIFIAINMIPDTIQKHYFFKPYVGRKIYNFPLDYSVEFYTIYEEACEAGIRYCLENLI